MWLKQPKCFQCRQTLLQYDNPKRMRMTVCQILVWSDIQETVAESRIHCKPRVVSLQQWCPCFSCSWMWLCVITTSMKMFCYLTNVSLPNGKLYVFFTALGLACHHLCILQSAHMAVGISYMQAHKTYDKPVTYEYTCTQPDTETSLHVPAQLCASH